jgi:hypothetical protein
MGWADVATGTLLTQNASHRMAHVRQCRPACVIARFMSEAY